MKSEVLKTIGGLIKSKYNRAKVDNALVNNLVKSLGDQETRGFGEGYEGEYFSRIKKMVKKNPAEAVKFSRKEKKDLDKKMYDMRVQEDEWNKNKK